jgi:DNA-binding transcriptional ArsR family regulator
MSRRSAAPVFAALGDDTRLELVSRLCAGGPLSTTQLAAGTEVTRQGITKHLSVLADAGIVRDARHGRERIWTIETRRLEVARRFLDQTSKRWDDAIDRLKEHVED